MRTLLAPQTQRPSGHKPRPTAAACRAPGVARRALPRGGPGEALAGLRHQVPQRLAQRLGSTFGKRAFSSVVFFLGGGVLFCCFWLGGGGRGGEEVN